MLLSVAKAKGKAGSFGFRESPIVSSSPAPGSSCTRGCLISGLTGRTSSIFGFFAGSVSQRSSRGDDDPSEPEAATALQVTAEAEEEAEADTESEDTADVTEEEAMMEAAPSETEEEEEGAERDATVADRFSASGEKRTERTNRRQ